MRKSEQDRFWEKVDKESSESGCWLWTAAKIQGYGTFAVGGRVHKKAIRAHRYSWALKHGPIPDGMFVLHACDNPACVNPDHLFIGNQRDNIHDMISKGRQATGDAIASKGEENPKAKLTEDDVRAIRKLNGRMPSRMVARKFGLEKTAVLRIWNRVRWEHLK